ncbi:GntR family transcriptional regulator [Microbulbifer bruguierae]|uniref:GntR family transcriptional regulator n=1 Tax=Microbulbifer bruguierae TaxID=3029061 RepID=A0ABY8NFM4_9GAMM|nr:GntR family transcriptional regulator [Microbulbifer bruguierae]WGL16293.1 GntR family transcriptional regulator [Microbulbifer bruguierae]
MTNIPEYSPRAMSTIDKLISPRQRKALDPSSHSPLYYQLYSLLKNLILNGTLANGALMPTEQQLSEAFDVSRITAKRAMDELAAENLVERRRGKGSHVIFKYTPGPVKAPLVGMLQEIESMARQTEVRLLELDKLKPPAEVREEFALDAGDTALRMVRVRSRDGEPFGYYDSWTVGLQKKPTARQLTSTPRLEIFRTQGLNITHVKQTLSAVSAPEDVAAALNIKPGTPLLSMVRRSYDAKEQLRDLMHVLYNPEHFQYQMDLTIDEI